MTRLNQNATLKPAEEGGYRNVRSAKNVKINNNILSMTILNILEACVRAASSSVILPSTDKSPRLKVLDYMVNSH